MSNKQYGVCVLRKYKRGAVCGIEQHVERRATISHTNPDIDRTQSHNDFDLCGQYQHDMTFNKIIKSRIMETGATGYDRKNGVVLCELLFSASHDFLKNMSPNDIRQYFQKCYEWGCKKYGKENVVSAMVHLDEKTPHLHFIFAPIVQKDGAYKFCANDLFNHKMEELQEEIHQEVFSKYGLERGTKKTRHLETLDWKITQLEEKRKEIEEQIMQLENTRDNTEYYKLNKKLKENQAMLKKMFNVLESNPELLEQYKVAAKELQEKEEQEQQKDETEEEKEIDQ